MDTQQWIGVILIGIAVCILIYVMSRAEFDNLGPEVAFEDIRILSTVTIILIIIGTIATLGFWDNIWLWMYTQG